MKPDTAIIIVTFNSAEHIAECLRSVQGLGEVIVVDNASTDKTCEVVRRTDPAVRLIANSANHGFAAAVNEGVRATDRPFILLLNPDAMLKLGLGALVAECSRTDVGAAGGKLVDSAGRPQIGFNVRGFPTAWSLAFEVLSLNRFWSSNPVNRRYRCLDLDPERSQDVDQPAGAFLMVRREVLRKVGGLDERFHPVWFEDVDLCLRIRQAGYRIRYVPECVAEHRGAHSIPFMPVKQRYLAWYGNLLRFTHKHLSKGTYRRLYGLVSIGLFLRWVYCLVGAGSSQEREAYQSVIRLLLGGHRFRDRDTTLPASRSSPIESKLS
jgi:GT2 family glycosyltransferase